jgi:hypothetical protein
MELLKEYKGFIIYCFASVVIIKMLIKMVQGGIKYYYPENKKIIKFLRDYVYHIFPACFALVGAVCLPESEKLLIGFIYYFAGIELMYSKGYKIIEKFIKNKVNKDDL